MGRRQRNKPDAEYSDLCRLEDIADGGAKGIRCVGKVNDTLFIVRRGGSVKAYRNLCPHQGASLPWRRDAYLNSDGTQIMCSAHGAKFDIETGICLSGPALGTRLERVDIRISDEGVIQARRDSEIV